MNDENDIVSLQHQVQLLSEELDAANEKLKKTWKSEQGILKKFTIIYDFAPMGFFMVDVTGEILEINFTGAELLGDKRAALAGSPFKLFISNESKPVFEHFLQSILSGGKKESCRVNLGYGKQSLVNVYIEGIRADPDGTCLLSVLDFSRFGEKA
ncbi:MAG: PAS domain-containing protein [Marinilabilia sp.]